MNKWLILIALRTHASTRSTWEKRLGWCDIGEIMGGDCSNVRQREPSAREIENSKSRIKIRLPKKPIKRFGQT